MDNETLADCILNLLKNEKDCDVIFHVGEAKERIPCHQFPLKARSPVFEIMFSERWKSEREIEIPDIEPCIFRLFLQFIYSDTFTTNISKAIKVLYVANKYDVGALVKKCELVMKSPFELTDAIEIYQAARQYRLPILKQVAGDLMAKRFSDLINDPSFTLMDEDTLVDLIARDDLLIDELKLFQVLMRWSCDQLGEENPKSSEQREVLQKILPLVRFPLINSNDFAMKVMSKNILTMEESVALLTYINYEASSRIKLETKLGFPCHPRSIFVSETDCTMRFYESDYYTTFEPDAFIPSSTDFDLISNHIDTVTFSQSWTNHFGSSSKIRKATITSVTLRGPDYSNLLDYTYTYSPWVSSYTSWQVCLRLEKFFCAPALDREICSSIIHRNVVIYGDRSTEVEIHPVFEFENKPGYKYRISVAYASDIYLPDKHSLHNHKTNDCISATHLKKNCTWKNNEGALELTNVELVNPDSTGSNGNSSRRSDFYSSHCIRSFKMNVHTTLV